MIDVMLDIETLGTKVDSPIIQISAIAFEMDTGKVVSKFNKHLDIKSQHMYYINVDTLEWWLMTDMELLRDKLLSENTERYPYIDCIIDFVEWLESLGEITLWGNGTLFDNNFIIFQYEDLTGEKFPLSYRIHRDVRTMVDLASRVSRLSEKQIRAEVDNPDVKHDSYYDCMYQIDLLRKCYSLMK